MPRSISNKRVLLSFVASLLFLSDGTAEQPAIIDDSSLKRSFEQKLTALFEKGEAPPAAELFAQLKKEQSGPINLATPVEKKTSTDGSDPLYRKVLPSTLLFGHLYKCSKCSRWHGSTAGGAVIGAGGIAITNYHVIDSSKAAAFGAMDHSGNLFPVTKILASSKKDDLAIVQLGNCELPPVSLGAMAEPGEAVHILSHPDGHYFSYTRGVVSRHYLLSKTKAQRMQVTADFARGSSGCGVFSDRGELIGLVASTNSIYYKQQDGEDQNLQMVIKSCVPVSRIEALIEG